MEKMSSEYQGAADWLKNKEWFSYDKVHDKFILKDSAPEAAKKSFSLWKKANKLD